MGKVSEVFVDDAVPRAACLLWISVASELVGLSTARIWGILTAFRSRDYGTFTILEILELFPCQTVHSPQLLHFHCLRFDLLVSPIVLLLDPRPFLLVIGFINSVCGKLWSLIVFDLFRQNQVEEEGKESR